MPQISDEEFRDSFNNAVLGKKGTLKRKIGMGCTAILLLLAFALLGIYIFFAIAILT